MSEKREIKVGDELVYIVIGFGEDVEIVTTKVEKARRYDFSVGGLRARTSKFGFYDVDPNNGVESIEIGEAPATYKAYVKTDRVMAWLTYRIGIIQKRRAIRKLVGDYDKFSKVKNQAIIDIYEILKAYE